MTLKKAEFIRRYGEEKYKKMRGEAKEQAGEWRKAHLDEVKDIDRKWRENHPEKSKANSIKSNREAARKGGRYYKHKQKYITTGLQRDKNRIRIRHGKRYKSYKQIIAPDSQLHHQWLPETANFQGVALVEKGQHMHGFIDVIQILEGEITLFTEEEIRMTVKVAEG